MKEREVKQKWFPFWADKWIFGSMRIEFDPEERAIWVDLLCLASKDNGYIRANEETPYPIKQLAGMLIVDENKLQVAIEKFIEKGKLERLNNGTLTIKKWDKYQISNRHKRRLDNIMSEKTDTMSEKTDSNNNIKNIQNIKNIKNNNRDIKEKEKYNSIQKKWNDFANKNDLPKIRELSKTRIGKINARLKEKDFDLDLLFKNIEEQPFLLGENKQGWTIDFDWVFQKNNYLKIMEMKYKNRKKKMMNKIEYYEFCTIIKRLEVEYSDLDETRKKLHYDKLCYFPSWVLKEMVNQILETHERTYYPKLSLLIKSAESIQYYKQSNKRKPVYVRNVIQLVGVGLIG